MTPDLIGSKYRIIREIARSNDIVYEAVDTSSGRRVAVKELNIPANLQGQARRERIERFGREARATAKLAHPNIVTVFDFGSEGDRYYIAMEYLEGGTLRDLLQQRGALSVNEAVSIASQVLDALTHAHGRRVIHRDVKPDNIYLLPGNTVKLTDFGIARLTEEASLTGDGQVFGTPSYMSPEQIVGKQIDHRTDLFSVGIVLYEMLAGRKPFTGDSVVTITYKIMHNQPPALHGVAFPLEQVVFKALHKEPGQRYRGADEMKRAIQDAEHSVQSSYSGGSGYSTGYGSPTSQPSAGYGGYAAAPLSGGYGAGGGFNPPSSQPPPTHYGSSGGAFGGRFGGALPGVFGAPQPTQAAPVSGSAGVFAPPTQQVPQSAGPAMQGPFATWGSPGQQPGVQNGAPPPPFAPYGRRRSSPTMSEGTRTFLMSLMIAVVLGGALGGGAMLFFQAYQRQQVRSSSAVLDKMVAEANALQNAKNYQGAIAKYLEVIKLGPRTEPGKMARTNLATTWNVIGLSAFERKDYRAAADYFGKVIDLYGPDAVYASNPADKTELGNAQYNLSKVWDRTGDRDSAMREWGRGRDGRVGAVDPNAPGETDMMAARIERAQKAYNEGNRLFKEGDLAGARAQWTVVLSEAPGTQMAIDAQAALQSTLQNPSFEP